eukprot:g6310.t1
MDVLSSLAGIDDDDDTLASLGGGSSIGSAAGGSSSMDILRAAASMDDEDDDVTDDAARVNSQPPKMLGQEEMLANDDNFGRVINTAQMRAETLRGPNPQKALPDDPSPLGPVMMAMAKAAVESNLQPCDAVAEPLAGTALDDMLKAAGPLRDDWQGGSSYPGRSVTRAEKFSARALAQLQLPNRIPGGSLEALMKSKKQKRQQQQEQQQEAKEQKQRLLQDAAASGEDQDDGAAAAASAAAAADAAAADAAAAAAREAARKTSREIAEEEEVAEIQHLADTRAGTVDRNNKGGTTTTTMAMTDGGRQQQQQQEQQEEVEICMPILSAGWPPVFFALGHRRELQNLPAVDLLLNHPKLDVNRTWQGYSPLTMAASHGKAASLARLMVHPDADVNMPDTLDVAGGVGSPDMGLTPLVHACVRNHPGCIRLLQKEKRTKVNHMCDNGVDALLAAYCNLKLTIDEHQGEMIAAAQARKLAVTATAAAAASS